jgi:peptidoglycan/LPS O-acetylase OafA/YrhL
MPERNSVARLLLVLYAIGTVAIAIPLAFALGDAGDLADTTSGKVLAAALLALGFGGLMAAHDPWRNRLLIQVLMAFTALAALAIAYRLAFEHHPHDRAWILLVCAAVTPFLFAIFYPRRPKD